MLVAVGCSAEAAQPTSTVEPFPNGALDAPVSEVSASSGRIWLEAPIGNYQEGWADLSMENGNLFVEVDVTPAEPVAQPAHIHTGSCDELGGVAYSLENIVGGHSMTEIEGVSISDVATGEYSINLHLSFSDFATFTACGEIPAITEVLPSAPEDSPATSTVSIYD